MIDPAEKLSCSAMAEPAEETAAAPAAPPVDGVSEEKASPPPARSRGFRFLGDDKSVHKALGGGKSMLFFRFFVFLFRFG